jgi:hypothetical protein
VLITSREFTVMKPIDAITEHIGPSNILSTTTSAGHAALH